MDEVIKVEERENKMTEDEVIKVGEKEKMKIKRKKKWIR